MNSISDSAERALFANYFAHKSAAERYARGRPFVHPTAIELFSAFAKSDRTFRRGLDVGCGTGQSTIAAAAVCDDVIGIDPSGEMLAHAGAHPRVKYQQSSAEELPFDKDHFDLVTVGLAMHWLNQPGFLAQACRVLRPNGWLVIYNSAFTGEMCDNVAFKEWVTQTYLHRYPSPPRHNEKLFESDPGRHGFGLRGRDDFSNSISLTLSQLVEYLLTQSNIIAAVERGTERLEDVAAWIGRSAAPYYADSASRTFLFAGKIWYLQKDSIPAKSES